MICSLIEIGSLFIIQIDYLNKTDEGLKKAEIDIVFCRNFYRFCDVW